MPPLIDCLLPENEIHLLAGPTGAGKTRWLFHTLLEWQAGLPILGHTSYPCHWIYASADRTAVSAKRTLDSMGIDPARIPFIAAWDRQLTINQIVEEAQLAHAKLLIIESFGSFVDHPATSTNVKRFMQAVSATIRKSDLTIIGVMESPKMKPKDYYSNPRQRVSGVASWGHFAETIILVEPLVGSEGTPKRTITVCPRNGPQLTLNAQFEEDGHLHYITLDAELPEFP